MSQNRWTWHGGGLAAARAHFGEGTEPWLDLSTGINPHAWPRADAVEVDWRVLPDEHALRGLEEAAAVSFGCDPDHVCAVPGTEVGLRLAGKLLVDPVYHVIPTYRTHGEMAPGSLPVLLNDLEQADGSSLILANPNNPDGHLIERAHMLALLARRGRKGWLVVDEAFADCHPGHSLADRIDDHSRLLIFRSFGKFFGLAGLRLGFVLGPREALAKLRAQLGAWPVSAAAIAIGTAAYRDVAWQDAMRDQLVAEAGRLDALLASHGLRSRGECPLFRLIESSSASALFESLAQISILTRPFAGQPNWLRVGLPGSSEGFDRLSSALSHHA
ncbi:MAG: threonine-phosphate decarboxylase [Tsuneonella suprasediminis]